MHGVESKVTTDELVVVLIGLTVVAQLAHPVSQRVIVGRNHAAFTKATEVLCGVEREAARITERAGVAQGTFYNYFGSRQELLDQLLPTIGLDMLKFIRARTGAMRPGATREVSGFRAFFDFLLEVPEFQRILNEAEVFAPAGYQKHLDNIAKPFVRLLRQAREAGEIVDYSDEEFEALVHMFMGARGYLSLRYAYPGGVASKVPGHVVTAYEKLMTRGLFRPDSKRKPTTRKRTT